MANIPFKTQHLNQHSDPLEEWPCTLCPALTSSQKDTFQEIVQLIRKSGQKVRRNETTKNFVEQVREKFLVKSPTCEKYFEILNVSNPSQEFQCNTLLHLAADNSDYEMIAVLLEAGAEPNATNRLMQLPLHTVVDEGDGCHCQECNGRNAKCVALLLNHGSSIDSPDWEGDTALSCSALSLMDDCAGVLWKHGASIYRGGMRGKAGELAVSYIPEEVSNWLNDAVKQDEKYKMKLHLDFGAVLGGVKSDGRDVLRIETKFLIYMSKAHKKARETLLLHPLVQAYLHLKWNAIFVLFLTLRTAYLVMVLMYTLFITSSFSQHLDFSTNHTKQMNSNNQYRSQWVYIIAIFLLLFLGCMLLNELYEMKQGLQKYLKNGLNYGWWLMIITVSINLSSVVMNPDDLANWQHVIAAFGVFLAWAMFLTQLSRDPKVGIYVEMLGKVVKEFLTFSATYFVLFAGFVFAFAILFPNNSMFSTPYNLLPFVKGLLMMNGEVDYDSLFDKSLNERAASFEYSVGAHIIFVGFITVMTILLMNLLLGLAIADIQELKRTATLSRTQKLIEQIHLLETLLSKNWIPLKLKKIFRRKFSIWSQCRFLNNKKKSVKTEKNWDDEDDDADTEDNISTNHEHLVAVKRVGPILSGFEPLRKSDDIFPEGLKEQFIMFVDKEECSKSKL